MTTQNYANHRRFVPMYHGVLFLLLAAAFVGSFVNLYDAINTQQGTYSASLIIVLIFCGLLQFWFSRVFAIAVQDRAIRAEENLRHFVMTGKMLDSRLTIEQIIGLRFASDEEYLPLAKRAVDDQLSREDIKKAVKSWRADHHRA